MNARKCVIYKSPSPVGNSRMNQARSEEEEKKRERQPNKIKTYLRNYNKAYLGTAQVNKTGKGTPNFP